jgi:nicotinamidase-related amidase
MTETALVLIDFQSERTNPESEYYVGDIQESLSKVKYLIEYCRARNYKIIWTKHRENDSIDEFGPESQLISELKQEDTDTIMIKNKISPFYNTSLDQELSDIKHVLVA